MKDDLLESFKQYHNANWHDGDNTFDERTYAKSNGEDFASTFVQDCFDHYEAGYLSGYEKAYKEQQKEIDKMREKLEEILNIFTNLSNNLGVLLFEIYKHEAI